MILFEEHHLLEDYLRKKYKKQREGYAYKSNFNRDDERIEKLIEDLYEYSFLTEIMVEKTKELFKEISPESKYLFDDVALNNHLNDHVVLTKNQRKDELLTVDNVCELLKVTRPTVYALIKEGKMRSVYLLERKRVRYTDYLDYLNSLK